MALLGPKVSVVQQRVTRTPDGIGGYTEAWSTVETMSVTLAPMNEREKLMYNKDTTVTMYHLYIEHGGRDIRTQDRFTYDGKTFEVIAAVNPVSMGFMWKATLMLVR